MFEFRLGNYRSSARYAYDGWRNLVPIRATLQAVGLWNEADSTLFQELKAPMLAGLRRSNL